MTPICRTAFLKPTIRLRKKEPSYEHLIRLNSCHWRRRPKRNLLQNPLAGERRLKAHCRCVTGHLFFVRTHFLTDGHLLVYHASACYAQLPGSPDAGCHNQHSRQTTYCTTAGLGRQAIGQGNPAGGSALPRLKPRASSACILVWIKRIWRNLPLHEPEYDLETTRMT
jgi:hypothetical protein